MLPAGTHSKTHRCAVMHVVHGERGKVFPIFRSSEHVIDQQVCMTEHPYRLLMAISSFYLFYNLAALAYNWHSVTLYQHLLFFHILVCNYGKCLKIVFSC